MEHGRPVGAVLSCFPVVETQPGGLFLPAVSATPLSKNTEWGKGQGGEMGQEITAFQ